MTRWKLTLEYDGTGFCGWQKQPDAVSIQQTLEDALDKFCGEPVALHVAGRTDAGVHARAQVAHVDIARPATPRTVCDATNAWLRPHKISVLQAEAVDKSFHARFDALQRSYRYTIINRRTTVALRTDYVWHIRRMLDVDKMKTAAALLIGHHDFSTFRALNCQSKSPLKTLEKLTIAQNGDEIVFDVAARSFLYHQVRNMVGSLTLVGTGRWTLDDFKSAFAARDRTKGGPTAPPQGLCFWEVTYPQKS